MSTKIMITCPCCHADGYVTDDFAGKPIKCLKCGTRASVPAEGWEVMGRILSFSDLVRRAEDYEIAEDALVRLAWDRDGRFPLSINYAMLRREAPNAAAAWQEAYIKHKGVSLSPSDSRPLFRLLQKANLPAVTLEPEVPASLKRVGAKPPPVPNEHGDRTALLAVVMCCLVAGLGLFAIYETAMWIGDQLRDAGVRRFVWYLAVICGGVVAALLIAISPPLIKVLAIWAVAIAFLFGVYSFSSTVVYDVNGEQLLNAAGAIGGVIFFCMVVVAMARGRFYVTYSHGVDLNGDGFNDVIVSQTYVPPRD